MTKPSFREYDEVPKRQDDIRVKAFGMEVEAAGKIVILTLIALAAVVGVAAHAFVTSQEHIAMIKAMEQLTRAQEVHTCVLTLNESERREFRTEGKYCGGFMRPRISFRDDASTVWRGMEAEARTR